MKYSDLKPGDKVIITRSGTYDKADYREGEIWTVMHDEYQDCMFHVIKAHKDGLQTMLFGTPYSKRPEEVPECIPYVEPKINQVYEIF